MKYAFVRLVQPENAELPILLTLLGIVMLVRLVQPQNAELPILLTLIGIVTPLRLARPLNTLLSIPVTGKPLISPGMFNTELEPVYPVMVVCPLVVV